jgi:hypothetical protein
MKLILCRICNDVVKCGNLKKRFCTCKSSWGKYIDQLNAEIGGLAIPICLHNSEMLQAIKGRPDTGLGLNFTAWVPARHCSTIEEK